jgi:hypothetical protein
MINNNKMNNIKAVVKFAEAPGATMPDAYGKRNG